MLVNIKPWVLKNGENLFSRTKRNNLDGPDSFQKYWHAKLFQNRITQQGIVEEDLLWSGGGGSHFQENLNYDLSVVDKKQQIMWRC